MRKRLTFVEQGKKESVLKNENGHTLMRSVEPRTNIRGLEALPNYQERGMHRRTNMDVSASSHHTKTVHVPKTLMSVPFLQHPALTAGQRRYLCSLANVYSTEHMRQQMKQHYLNVLHTCIQSGQSSNCRRRYVDHQYRENGKFTKESEKDVVKEKKQWQNKSSSSTVNSAFILPKIVNRRQI